MRGDRLSREETAAPGRRRAGGRRARRALRNTGGPDKSAYAGLPGGQYKPLGEADIARIHRAALEILETVKRMASWSPICSVSRFLLALKPGAGKNSELTMSYASASLCFGRAA